MTKAKRVRSTPQADSSPILSAQEQAVRYVWDLEGRMCDLVAATEIAVTIFQTPEDETKSSRVAISLENVDRIVRKLNADYQAVFTAVRERGRS